MTSRLPPEIYYLFIDELADSPQLLKSFSFVSHVWLSRCRTHLFRRFSLHCMPSAAHDADEEYSECWYPTDSFPANPDAAATCSEGHCSLKSLLKIRQIQQSIRELSLIEGSLVDSSRFKKLDFGVCLSELAANIQFPNLNALAVSFSGPGPREYCLGVTAVGEIMRIHSNLEHLCISSLYLDTHCLQNLLSSMRVCAQLSSIQLECITCAAGTESLISCYSSLALEEKNKAALSQWSRAPVQRLSLSDVDLNLVEVLFSPTKPTIFQTELKSLSIDCSDLDSNHETMEGSVGFRLIDRHASSLQHLLLKHPKAISHAFYEPLLGMTLPFLSIIEIHFINVHDGRFRYALENLCFLRSPISELRIVLKYGPRTAFTPPIDRSLINFSRSLQSLRRVRFKVNHMIDKFSCEHLPKANLQLQLEIVQDRCISTR